MRSVASSCRAGVPGCLDSQQALKTRVPAGGCIQQGGELPELVRGQAEKHLIQHHGLRSLAGSFDREVRTAFAQQGGGVINQVTLLRQCSRVDGGVTKHI